MSQQENRNLMYVAGFKDRINGYLGPRWADSDYLSGWSDAKDALKNGLEKREILSETND